MPKPVVAGSPRFDLGPEFDCGYPTVPENRAMANGRSVPIAVAILKATLSIPDPTRFYS
jgi:hypothetical protein